MYPLWIVASAPDEDEETSTDVVVEVVSEITATVDSPAPTVSPAEEEPSTSRLDLRAPVTTRVGRDPSIGRPSDDATTEDSSVSLLTPRLDASDLARQLALSGDGTPRDSGAGDYDDETGELGTTKMPPVPDPEDTLERRPPPDAGDEDDDDETEQRMQAFARPGTDRANAAEQDARSRLGPMRPRLDSEAAAQWPPWHAQPEEARAALRGVASPVASGTEILPRTAVEEAFRMVGPALALGVHQPSGHSQDSVAPRVDIAATDPLAHRLEAPAAKVPVTEAPSTDAPDPPGRSPSPSAGERSRSTPSAATKGGLSPFAVFLFAFLFTGGVFGGLIASRRFPMFEGLLPLGATTGPSEPAAASDTPPATSIAVSSASIPSASSSPSASAAPTSSASSAPAASAAPTSSASSAPAASASASAPRTKTKSIPRPRGKSR